MAPIKFEGNFKIGSVEIGKPILSLSNTFKTLQNAKSWVFIWTSVFAFALVASSAVAPGPSVAWFFIFTVYFLSILLFILVTARIVVNIDDFFGSFFTLFCLLSSVNALINLYDYFYALKELSEFANTRLSPDFGRAPDHYITTGAMTYATGFVAAAGLGSVEKNVLRKSIAAIAALILFIVICLTQSRGPLLGALMTIAVMCFIHLKGRLRLYMIGAPWLALASFLLFPKIGIRAVERGGNHRFELWKKFLNLSLHRLLLGYGERIEFRIEISDGEKLGHAHNIFLSGFARGGFLAFLSLIIACSLSLLKTYQFSQICNNPIPFGLILVMILAGLVDFDLIVFLTDWQWVSFWMPLGLAVAAERRISTKIVP